MQVSHVSGVILVSSVCGDIFYSGENYAVLFLDFAPILLSTSVDLCSDTVQRCWICLVHLADIESGERVWARSLRFVDIITVDAVVAFHSRSASLVSALTQVRGRTLINLRHLYVLYVDFSV